LTGVMPLGFAAWLAFGRYGQVKFGSAEEKPEYSDVSWTAMMFTASMGASLIAWGFAEPIFYVQTPPLGLEKGSAIAFEFAHMYPIFHWSLAPWAMYCLPSIPIAYMLYVRKARSLRISDSCEEAIPNKGKEVTKTVIDILVVISIVGGVATSIGFGVPLVSSLLVEWQGFADTLSLKIYVIIGWTAIFGTSAYLGLKKGIKVLADLNLGMMFFVMIFIVVLGPTVYILSLSTNSLGLFLDQIIRISFWTDPIAREGFPQAWTIFYWAWWFAYAPMMGLFFARISRGRTIRQVVFGVIGYGCLGTFTFLSIAGAYVLHLEGNGLLDAISIINNEGMGPLVAKVIGTLPAPGVILAVTTILSIVFYATTFDSAAYVLASICTKNLPGDEEPNKFNRLAWASGLGLVAVGLMVTGAKTDSMEETVQSMTVVTSLFALPVLFMMCFTLYRWLGRDFPQLAKKKVYTLE
ncbi:MAG: BCCT family transporter, partial [Pseudomonadota bacterium]